VTSDWDAATYDRIADPMYRWGLAVVEWLGLEGRERVLDAGCGSGRVTEVLLERLPQGSVVALDASSAMLEEARRRLSRFGQRVEYVRADLAEPLPVQGSVDAVLSTATFHWIRDHDALFRNLAACLRPGGRLAAQCGAAGNIQRVLRAAALAGLDPRGPTYFPTPEETRSRLEAAGFVDVEVWTKEEPTPIEAGEPLVTYLRTVCLRGHLEQVPAAERLPKIRYVHISSMGRDGRFGQPADIGFFAHRGQVCVGTRPESWRVRRLRAGRPRTGIAVGAPEGPGTVRQGQARGGSGRQPALARGPRGWTDHAVPRQDPAMNPKIEIRRIREGDPFELAVTVRDAHGATTHRVILSEADRRAIGGPGATPERCIEAAFRFLLDQEPKEAILARFDVDTIRRYFPEFDREIASYLR
jgi:trans-aconitate 2-methyltransferase